MRTSRKLLTAVEDTVRVWLEEDPRGEAVPDAAWTSAAWEANGSPGEWAEYHELVRAGVRKARETKE